MVDLVEDVKHRARLLHKQARLSDPAALARLRAEPELQALDDAALLPALRRRHCLATLARELGFQAWPHAKAVLGGEPVTDYGTLLHRERGGAYWNLWLASYDEAKDVRAEHGGTLLPYRRQFLVVEPPYLEALGLDPADPDWERIGRDWVRPAEREAWTRLTSAAIDARLRGWPD